MEAAPVDFFISYTSLDVAWGRWIDRLLRDRGYTTVLQLYDFAAGDSFVEKIHEALGTCNLPLGPSMTSSPSPLFLPGHLVLRGQEVTLRPLDHRDAESLARASAESREHYRYNPVPDGIEEARAYAAKALREKVAGARFPFTIVWRERVVGTTSYSDFQPWEWPAGSSLQRIDRPDAVEVGYTWLAASAQRTRCNTEAKYLLFKHAFEVWEVHRVSLRTDVRNERSRHAIERIGAHFEGVRRADKPGRDGTVRDSAYYSIVQAEWPAVAAKLEARLNRMVENLSR